jgi:hypothetical protein
MRGEFTLARGFGAPQHSISINMNDFDEPMTGSHNILGMMANGQSQHPNVLGWATDFSAPYPFDDFEIIHDDYMDELDNDEEEMAQELAVELAKVAVAEVNERGREMCTSMIPVSAGAAQTAMQNGRSAARQNAIREAEAARKQAEEEEAEREFDISTSAADSRVTCEQRGSVRGPVPAATRPRILEKKLTKAKYAIHAILDTNRGSGEVLVGWDSRWSPTWEDLSVIKPQVSVPGWKDFMSAKSRRLEQQVSKGFVGPYASGTELGYATEAMVLSGDDPRRAAVGHQLWKVTGRRGIAKAT